MLKLRRLRIEKFRSVAKGAELSFSDGINVLLGQNGTGKTTLLELISMVVRSDFSSLAKEEFAIEYELAADEGESIVVVMRNDRAAKDPLPRQVKLGAREGYRPSAEVLGATDRRLLTRRIIGNGDASYLVPEALLRKIRLSYDARELFSAYEVGVEHVSEILQSRGLW